MSSQLPFDEHFQTHFINHMLRDSEFLMHVKDATLPELFSSQYAQQAVRLIRSFADVEEAAPGTLIFTTLDTMHQRRLIPDDAKVNLSKYLDDLFGLPLQNRGYLLKEFDRFIRHQMFARNIAPAAEFVKQGEFDKAEQLLQSIFTFRAPQEQKLGTMYTEDPSLRITRRLQEDEQRMWTLIPEVDARVLGLKRGELGVWQSQRSSAGKSAALVLLARSFVLQGKRVLIYTLEMSEEDYEDRLDMCIAGLMQDQLRQRTIIQQKLRALFKTGGGVLIKQFPGYMTTVEDLQKHKLQTENVLNFHADAVIVDYADELAPSSRLARDAGSFDVGKAVYSQLRGWAVQDQVCMWTGMQSNRGGMEAVVADQEHSGESIAKAWIADVIISINRTPEEEQQGLTRLFIVKNRRGKARFPISIRTDFDRMQFWRRES